MQEKQEKSITLLLAILYSSAFLAGFNENLMNVAFVSIMSEFGVDSVAVQWTVTGYMIVGTVVVMCMAFLYRRIPLRTLYFVAAGFSFVGSLMGIFAVNFVMLMIARLIQAVGSGVFIPLMMNTILAVAPKKKLGTYMSIGSCMITFGPAFAPVVCGAVVTAFGWHSIFVAPTIVMLVLAAIAVPSVYNLKNEEAHLDVLSVVLSAIFLSSLSLGLVMLTLNSVVAAVSLVVMVASVALFIVRQLRSEHPLIDLTPMKSIAFWPSIVLTTIAMMGSFSCSVLFPMYLEGAIGLSAFLSGLVILFPVLGNAGAALVGGRIMDKRGEWPLLCVGYTVVACGFVLMALFATKLSLVGMFVGAFLVMSGTGLIFSPSQTAGFKTLSREQNPFGVALSTTFVQIAACIAPSLYTGILSSGQAASLAAGASAQIALANGFSSAMTVAVFVALAGSVIGFFYARAAVKRNTTVKSKRKALSKEQRPLAQLIQPKPYVLPINAPVSEAMKMFVELKVGGIPLVDVHGKPAGFISDGDVIRLLADKHPLVTNAYSLIEAANNQSFDERLGELINLSVREVGNDKLISLDASATLEEACVLLSTHKLKKVPVVQNEHIVGTINRSDILRYAMERSLQMMSA